MKRVVVGVGLSLLACGSSKPHVTGNVASTPPRTTTAPAIPAAWSDLQPGVSVKADLDADGTLETIAVGGTEDERTVQLDGAPYQCQGTVATFSHASIVDIDPAIPGLELVLGQHLGDNAYAYCYVYKHRGAVAALEVGNSRIEDKLVLVDGTCEAEPTAYKRTAEGFHEDAGLAAGKLMMTSCCEGDDCP